MNIIKPSIAELLELAKIAWRKAPIAPDLVITFCTGGLYTVGLFQTAGMPKCPVYALPWSRVELSEGKFVVAGDPIRRFIPPEYLQSHIAVIDDIFDTGSTFSRLVSELYDNPYQIPSSCSRYAPYEKTCFVDSTHPNLVGKIEGHVGKVIASDDWAWFPWEPTSES